MIEQEQEASKNEAILALLAEYPDGLSAHRIVRLLEARGVVIRSTGQAIGRLRVLRAREKVVDVEGAREGWRVWKLV